MPVGEHVTDAAEPKNELGRDVQRGLQIAANVQIKPMYET